MTRSNYKKGMSQILTLIVAASVLMMTALTLVFMAQGGLGDTFTGSNRQSCQSTVETRCSTVGTTRPEFQIPESCQTEEISASELEGVTEGEEPGTFACE